MAQERDIMCVCNPSADDCSGKGSSKMDRDFRSSGGMRVGALAGGQYGQFRGSSGVWRSV